MKVHRKSLLSGQTLDAGDSFGIELSNTVYALDSTTIDLCLSLSPWALFRTIKSAVKMHTLLDLRGKTPRFALPSFIHISDGKVGDGKAQPRLLFAALRIGLLIARRIGHRYSRAVKQLDWPTLPPPSLAIHGG